MKLFLYVVNILNTIFLGFPLQHLIPSCIFNIAKPEIYFTRNKRNDKPTEFVIHRHVSQFLANENQLEPVTHNKKLNLSCIFVEIRNLLNDTAIEIEYSKAVQKIFNVSFALLHTFLVYLKQLEQNCSSEDIIYADVVYLRQKSMRVSDFSIFDGR